MSGEMQLSKRSQVNDKRFIWTGLDRFGYGSSLIRRFSQGMWCCRFVVKTSQTVWRRWNDRCYRRKPLWRWLNNGCRDRNNG
jgi:hypothetical protein